MKIRSLTTNCQNGPESEEVEGISGEGEEGLCVEGCHCPADSLLWKGACVPKHSCPCFHKGVEYGAGAELVQGCNTCQCQAGQWQCSEEVCKANQTQ